MKKKYNIVYSLGRDCACAQYMIKTNIRVSSGPFDWLTNASFKERFDLLLSDFEGYFNKDDLVKMEKPKQFPSDKQNDYYRNIKTNLFYWHDFPNNISFEKAYINIKNKYDRRIKRFYNNLKKEKNVLLIWYSQLDHTPDDQIIYLCDKFCKKIGKNIDFMIIEHVEGVDNIKSTKLKDNIIKYNLHARKEDVNGIPLTLGDEEKVLPLFQQISIDKKNLFKLKHNLLKFLVHFICIFIPYKKIRKEIRNKFLSNINI